MYIHNASPNQQPSYKSNYPHFTYRSLVEKTKIYSPFQILEVLYTCLLNGKGYKVYFYLLYFFLSLR